jgi:SAM-dependent methyltransferase
MLALARAATEDRAITYTRADMEDLELPAGSFDLVHSALALHYVENLNGLMAEVHSSLAAGGSLVFSVEHPMFTAPAKPGWLRAADGHSIWPIDSHLDEGPRSTDWLTKGVIKQHRTLATYINMLTGLGFAISHVEEWGPTEEQVRSWPNLADDHQRPPFLLVAANR